MCLPGACPAARRRVIRRGKPRTKTTVIFGRPADILAPMVEPHVDLARARSEAASRLAARDRDRASHERGVNDALRRQDERMARAIAEFLEATRRDRVQAGELLQRVVVPGKPFRPARYESICGHVVWARYEDECLTRKLAVLTSGHVLFSHGHLDGQNRPDLERYGDYWRRGASCCNGELPFHLSRGAHAYARLEVGHRDTFWESWPEREVVGKIEETAAWFVRVLAEYLEKALTESRRTTP